MSRGVAAKAGVITGTMNARSKVPVVSYDQPSNKVKTKAKSPFALKMAESRKDSTQFRVYRRWNLLGFQLKT